MKPKKKRWADFYLIGAMKAGSTTLYHCLNKHPDIFMSKPKEPGFFSRDERFSKGELWYFDHFRGALNHQILGDSSTCYSRYPTYPNAAKRIYSINPNARFIYVVRDPVIRAYSHYKHRMDEAIISGKSVISYKQFLNDDEEVLMAGRYYYQIKFYYDLFGSDHIHICSFDALVNETESTLLKICRFLRINPNCFEDVSLPHLNESGSSVANFHAKQLIDSMRERSAVKNIISIVPSTIKDSVYSAVKNQLRKSKTVQHKTLNYRKTISTSDEQDEVKLAEYYKDDLIDLSRICEVDVRNWLSFSNSRFK